MRILTTWVPFLFAACAVSGAGKTNTASALLRPIVAIEGPNSHITKARFVRIRTPQQMATVWLDHIGSDSSGAVSEYAFYSNHEGVPQIDFESHEVVGVFPGLRWNSAGVAVVEVVDEPGCRRLRYDGKPFQTSGPGPTGGGLRNVPYGIFVLPKTTLPIVVEEGVRRMIGDPRLWEERARLP